MVYASAHAPPMTVMTGAVTDANAATTLAAARASDTVTRTVSSRCCRTWAAVDALIRSSMFCSFCRALIGTCGGVIAESPYSSACLHSPNIDTTPQPRAKVTWTLAGCTCTSSLREVLPLVLALRDTGRCAFVYRAGGRVPVTIAGTAGRTGRAKRSGRHRCGRTVQG